MVTDVRKKPLTIIELVNQNNSELKDNASIVLLGIEDTRS